MNEVFFNGDRRESITVQNDHYDEMIDVSADDEDEILSSDGEGDHSPTKTNRHYMDLSNDSSSESSLERKAAHDMVDFTDLPLKDSTNDQSEVNNDDEDCSVETICGTNDEGQTTPLNDKIISSRPEINKDRNQKLDAIPKVENDNYHHDGVTSIANDNGSSKEMEDGILQQFPPELKELFKCIDEYEPKKIKIQPELHCFIPSYLPSIGDVDPFIKVPRPDNIPDGLGIQVIDEPSTKQSDAALLDLQLKTQLKKKMRRHGSGGIGPSSLSSSTQIRSIENASKNTYEIDKWIESVQELHASRPVSTGEVRYKNPSIIPSIEELMVPFPEKIHDEFITRIVGKGGDNENSNDSLLDPSIDLTLEDYIKVICSLLDIPVVEGHLVQSLYVVFNLSLEYQKDVNGDTVSIL